MPAERAYQRLNTDSNDEGDSEAHREHLPSYKDDDRFYEPPVPAWKRVLLIAFILLLVYWFYQLRSKGNPNREPDVVHADRYSDQYKYRPAASPIIRKRLPDGRIEVRGDHVAQAQRRHRSDEL